MSARTRALKRAAARARDYGAPPPEPVVMGWSGPTARETDGRRVVSVYAAGALRQAIRDEVRRG